MSGEQNEPARQSKWDNFWSVNIGHVLIVLGMAGSAWMVVNNVETTLADHTSRIATLEAEVTVSHRETQDWQQRTSGQLNDLARDVSKLQGQVQLLVPPMQRGELTIPRHDGGG